MKIYRVYFDNSIPVDDIPEDFEFCCDGRICAFNAILDDWYRIYNEFPILDVTENGCSVYDDFNDWACDYPDPE